MRIINSLQRLQRNIWSQDEVCTKRKDTAAWSEHSVAVKVDATHSRKHMNTWNDVIACSHITQHVQKPTQRIHQYQIPSHAIHQLHIDILLTGRTAHYSTSLNRYPPHVITNFSVWLAQLVEASTFAMCVFIHSFIFVYFITNSYMIE